MATRQDDLRRHSRWLMRVMEWNDPRARYPNVWHDGMPRHVLAYASVASRLRLGDLIGIFYPSSQSHPERAERFVGLSRVVGLRRADDPAYAWLDLETAHRFDPPLDLGQGPRRVFLCCDPGWPQREVALFQRLLDEAIAQGFSPQPGDTISPAPPKPAAAGGRKTPEGEGPPEREPDASEEPGPSGVPSPPLSGPAEPTPAPPLPHGPSGAASGRLFGGVDFSGDMRDPKEGTWLALLELRGDGLLVTSLRPTGRAGLQALLRDSGSEILKVEAIGLDFPFGLPIPFAEELLGGPFPEDGWWALARRLERMTRPEYLSALKEFRDASGELKRYTDEVAGACSPLHRVNPDLGPMTYHGIRLVAEMRSRYAIRPFETARGRLLLEVYPGWLARKLAAGREDGKSDALLAGLERLARWPVEVPDPFRGTCLASRDALDAVLAARAAAVAVLTGEADRPAASLAPEHADRVRLEGWIYGVFLG